MAKDKNISPIFAKIENRRRQEEQEKAQAEAIAYYSRHGIKDGGPVEKTQLIEGLSITRNNDGVWLDFGSPGERQAMIHMDMIGPQGHPESVINKAIDDWVVKFINREPMKPKTFLDRLKIEIEEVIARHDKLNTFINADGTVWEHMDPVDKQDLLDQRQAMALYRGILMKRYDRLTLKPV